MPYRNKKLALTLSEKTISIYHPGFKADFKEKRSYRKLIGLKFLISWLIRKGPDRITSGKDVGARFFTEFSYLNRAPLTHMTLSELRKGQRASISFLNVTGNMRRRLQDIGLVKGSEIECIGTGPLGDPHAYMVKGAVIAIRQKEAKEIEINYNQTL